MSITIKHKKSAVASSKPTGAQIDNGEIAINYSDTDPALYIKDSTGAVIRIAGDGAVGSPPDASETVKGIAEIATQAEVTAGTDDGRIVSPLKLKQALGALPPGTTVGATAPLAPESGQAFFDTTTNTLKIWDGTAWQTPASPVWDEGTGGLIPATATNNVYVGGTAAAPKIKLTATDGSSELQGDMKIGGTLPASPNITLANTGAITAAEDATIHGVTVGLGKGSVAGNTAVGQSTLFNITTGGSNTAIGNSALYKNSGGTNNTAVGRSALQNNSTGGENVAVGQSALFKNTIGTSNTAVGQSALNANIIGTSNTAVGRSALNGNTGNSNSAVGQSSLRANTIGNNNAALGQSALDANTEGNSNTAVGQGALYSNITGSHNVALGGDAGHFIKGSNNTILGAYRGTAVDATLSDTVVISAGTTERARCHSTGIWNLGTSAPVYTDNATAKAGGLVDGDVYRKADGTLMIVFT